ncbi:MAG TPA: transcription factor S [Acidobacteriota bacterium]|nr:transcription factor S [Acidobacteriota bacterium]
MKFCTKCGSLMLPRKDGKNTIMACTNCKYTNKQVTDVKISEDLSKKGSISIVDEASADSTLPTTKVDCEKCGHKEAYYWLVQTRASDEPATKFMKCVKCKHTWRDYE